MKTLQEIVNKSKRLVFFGGAGVSTESVLKTPTDKYDINSERARICARFL